MAYSNFLLKCYQPPQWRLHWAIAPRPIALLSSWARLYKGWITLSKGLIAIKRISDRKHYGIIHRKEIYLADSVIRPSDNRCLMHISRAKIILAHWPLDRAPLTHNVLY